MYFIQWRGFFPNPAATRFIDSSVKKPIMVGRVATLALAGKCPLIIEVIDTR
jgi:hypothetical protein